jgi:hypothetical protein
MSGVLLMVAAMGVAVGLVGLVGFLLVRGAEPPDDRVSGRWISSHIRDRRDDA